ncbi:hypothetical protein JCM3765_004582 [Sporobolomyces pararoseus]
MNHHYLIRLLLYTISSCILVITFLAIRLLFVLRSQHSSPQVPPPKQRPRDAPASLAIFLGSGGHTAEMMRLVAHLDWKRYCSRTWIISSGDTLSESKALEFEKTIASGNFEILKIPRARKVHQSYLTSPFTTLYSLSFCLYYITISPLLQSQQFQRKFADLILLNGPGSCVPIAFSAFLPRLFFLHESSPKLVYIESLARTKRLSLSAKLVRPIVDRFFVQWESLRSEIVKKENERSSWGRLKAKVECQGWLV